MPEEVVKARLISRLIADGFLTPESTTPRISRLIKDKGLPFAIDAAQQLEQRGLTGVAASLFLDELDGMSREHAERRLDEHLARKMAKQARQRELPDAITQRARGIASMRKDGLELIGRELGWEEVWSIFVRLGDDEAIRGRMLIPGLLGHYWRKSLGLERAKAPAAP